VGWRGGGGKNTDPVVFGGEDRGRVLVAAQGAYLHADAAKLLHHKTVIRFNSVGR
jgi:hypothetical protein